MTQEEINKFKDAAMRAIRDAEKAAYDWYCACEVGRERERAATIYENVRTSTRVPL